MQEVVVTTIIPAVEAVGMVDLVDLVALDGKVEVEIYSPITLQEQEDQDQNRIL
ncbi:hypothetical protein D3C87_2198210 [compost metagenome]